MKKSILLLILSLSFAGRGNSQKIIPNYAAADLVLGQKDFVSEVVSSPDSSFSLSSPMGIVVDPVSGKVFVSEYYTRRVLRYPNASSLQNGAGAEAVFGNSSFSQISSTVAANTIGGPVGIHLDRYGRLWVADYIYHRVLMYEAAVYRADQPTADKVLGQPDFTTSTLAASAAKLNRPYGVWVDSQDTLWVADTDNNRVLRFNNVSSKYNGSAADGVLGQSDFTSSTRGASSSKFYSPASISISSTGALYVADCNNSRIMIFDNAASLGNGAGASRVLGQPDFVTSSFGLSSTKMDHPYGVLITAADTLWVSDLNNRLIRFSAASTKANGAASDGVVGQPNFTTNTLALNQRGSLNNPICQPFVDASGSLWIADTDHNRVLRFPADVTPPLLTLTSSVPKTTTKKKITIKGIASDAYGISKVQYRIGTGSLKMATGTTAWQFTASLKVGKNTITIYATDSVGNVSLSKIVKIKRS